MVSALPINPGNTVEVRRLLDNAVFEVFEEAGYHESTFWGNIKLVMMAVACGVAVFAQFNPYEFPDNRWVLGLCCATYLGLSVLLQVIVWVVDKDFVMFYRTKDAKQAAAAKGIGVRADLPAFEHHYTLIIETLHDKNDDSAAKKDNDGNDVPFVRVEMSSKKTSIEQIGRAHV